MTEKISIIIVNYNGKVWLKGCLTSLFRQSYKNFEVIFVDNASTDGSIEFVKNHFPKVKLVVNKENLGFSGGNNIGYERASGEFILFLNNDTEVSNDFLEKFINSFKKLPKASIIQSKIVYLNDHNKIDSCGSFWTDSSFLYYIGNNKNANDSRYNKPFKEFSTKGASMMVKRNVIDKIGLFNDNFWNYYEETDFCHRAWIAGFETWYSPEAVCYHANGGTSLSFKNEFIQFHNFKNKLSSFLINFEIKTLILVLPVFLLMNLLISVIWLFGGRVKHSFALFKALAWNISNMRNIIIDRNKVQMLRANSDKSYLNKVKRNPRLSYYYHLLKDNLGLYYD